MGPPSFGKVVEIVEHHVRTGPVLTVTSALNGVTDALLELASVASEKKGNGTLQKGYEFLREIHFSLVGELFAGNERDEEDARLALEAAFSNLEEALKLVSSEGLTPANSDLVVHFGELMATTIFARYLKFRGFDALFLPADELIETNAQFKNALPHMNATRERVLATLKDRLKPGAVVCVPGFYGATKGGQITTLGRGGSDFTATILANCLSPQFVVDVTFWKDVDGLLSTNPRLEPEARLLREISYAEAKELAFYGSKVLHPLCLNMLEEKDVPAYIRGFHHPFEDRFTKISAQVKKDAQVIKAITALEKVAMVTVESQAMVALPGTAAKLFSIMGSNNINISFISQSSSENNITFTTNLEEAERVEQLLCASPQFGKRWFRVKVDTDVALVAVVGAGMLHQPGIAGRVFTSLGRENVNVIAIAQGSSEMNISFIISRSELQKAIRALHREFIK
ncbi:MAG: aspartate kinase [Promethearchaeota archaeon]